MFSSSCPRAGQVVGCAMLRYRSCCAVRAETGLSVVGPHATRVQHMLVRTAVCHSTACSMACTVRGMGTTPVVARLLRLMHQVV